MKNKNISLLLLSTLISTNIFAFNLNTIGGDIEVGYKTKDYEEGGASRNFRENNVSLTLKPNKNKSLAFKFGFANRDFYESSKDENRTMSEFYIENMYIFGKLMFRPEIGFKYTDFNNDDHGMDDAKEYRFYPKFTYNINRNWSIYSRGFIAYTELKNPWLYNKENQYGYKHRLEGGARYKFNRKNALSIAISDETSDVNKFNYNVEGTQLRVRYHYSPSRNLKIVPYIFLTLDGERTSEKNESTRVKRDKLGVNIHYDLNRNLELIGKLSHEWRDDKDDYKYRGQGNKNNWFYSAGLKYSF